MSETLAAISDIHGNRWALEAVLRDIGARGINNIVNLGDSLYGPLDAAGTAEILIPRMIPTVRGNEDRLISETKEEIIHSDTISFVTRSLSEQHQTWLKSLWSTLTIEDLFLCHGTPAKDTEYLLWKITRGGKVLPREADDVQAKVGSLQASLVLCGHSHVPHEIQCPDGTWVVDPGSVGLQAFTDDVPPGHKMMAGSPHARYSIIHKIKDEIRVERVELDYDWNSAAGTAQRNGRDDWACWLRMGIA